MITEGEELMPESCSGIPTPRWAVASVAADGKTQPFQVGPTARRATCSTSTATARGAAEAAGVEGLEPQLMAVTPQGLQTLTTLPPVPYFGCPC
jgi:hypothetical protein